MTVRRSDTGAGRDGLYRERTVRVAALCSAVLLHAAALAGQPQTFSMPSFGPVTVYVPASPPEQVVLFISGDGGWNLGVVSMAERLRETGALVAGIDIRRFLRSLESGGDCAYPAGALEELSQAVQRRWKVAEYRRPILVGYSSGATLVYAALAAARLFSLPRVGHGFAVPRNWEPQMLEAYRAIVSQLRTESPPSVAIPGVGHLPLVEVPATAGSDADTMAVLLSGDGGWADLDRAVAAALAAAGVPVVGWDSLRYFWTARTPEAAAADLATVMEHYQAQWRRTRVILIGYSFGADALPFLVTRLPALLLRRVDRVVLLGLSDTAALEFHMSSWLGGGGDQRFQTAPEVRRLTVPLQARSWRGPSVYFTSCGRAPTGPIGRRLLLAHCCCCRFRLRPGVVASC